MFRGPGADAFKFGIKMIWRMAIGFGAGIPLIGVLMHFKGGALERVFQVREFRCIGGITLGFEPVV